jgi:hypothetical protein
MNFYDSSHKDYQRETWAGFNKGLFILGFLILLGAVINGLWDGEAQTFFIFKIALTVFAIVVVSLILYCAVYKTLGGFL